MLHSTVTVITSVLASFKNTKLILKKVQYVTSKSCFIYTMNQFCVLVFIQQPWVRTQTTLLNRLSELE